MPIDKRYFTFLFLFLLTSYSTKAQQTFLPMQDDVYRQMEMMAAGDSTVENFHTSFKPWLNSQISPALNPDSLYGIKKFGSQPDNGFLKKLWYNLKNDHLVTIDKDILHLTIDPAFDFAAGRDISNEKTLYTNTRGVVISGDLGKKFSFATEYFESQARFAGYLQSFIKDTTVVPGQGRIKKFKNDGYDYSSADGYISYAPSRYINFQLGHGKNFIGDGYRSLILSDNAFRYPFFKITADVWKLRYAILYAEFLDIRDKVSYDDGYLKKFGTFHYLNFLAGSSIEAGLFEGVIWQATDSAGNYRGFDFDYLNPVIFLHAAQYGLGSPDNSVVGATIRINLIRQLSFYGQLMVDDFDFEKSKNGSGFYRNKYGWQAGVKYFNAFGVKNLFAQTEFNLVRPYTYAQKSPTQNYAHYNQSLAHPLGANFKEWVSFLSYRYRRFFIEGELMYAMAGTDPNDSTNVGHNIYLSDLDIPGSYDSHGDFVGTYENFTGQGIKNQLMYAQLRVDLLINPKMNLNIELLAAHRRQETVSEQTHTNYFSIGLKTNLFNKYYDF